MKTIVAILLLGMTGAALADTVKPATSDKPYIYDSARQRYQDDRLRSHRLQEAPQPGLDNSGKAEKKDRGLGIG